MEPDHQPPDHLPPHLEFAREFAKPIPEDPDEAVIHIRRLIALAKKNRKALQATGAGPDEYIATLERTLADFEKQKVKVEEAEDKLLTAMANRADGMHRVYQSLKDVVEELSEKCPSHPALPEAKELLEELEQQMPKE